MDWALQELLYQSQEANQTCMCNCMSSTFSAISALSNVLGGQGSMAAPTGLLDRAPPLSPT